MNKFQKYAQELIKTQSLEKALLISEGCLAVTRNVPNTYHYDEAAWYLDKDGSLQLSKDQKKFAGIRERRLNETANFWVQVNAILKKEAKNVKTA